MFFRSSIVKSGFLLAFLMMSAMAVTGCAGGAAREMTTTPAISPATPEAPSPTAEVAKPTTPVQTSAEVEKITLIVFAAASLSDAFTTIGRQFDTSNPGVTTVFNFAGSNQLATQINGGAPADIFASANTAQMDVVVESGMVDAAAPTFFVSNRLVVVIPADNPGEIQTLQDLAVPGTLLVLAAEEVPVGRYSLGFLDKASADPAFGAAFRDDVLANVASYEENVRSVLNKVVLGEADAGIVYASDLVGVDGVSSLEIPDELNLLAEYPIATIGASAHPDVAAAFVEYVLSMAGQAVLQDYGFQPAVR